MLQSELPTVKFLVIILHGVLAYLSVFNTMTRLRRLPDLARYVSIFLVLGASIVNPQWEINAFGT